MSWLRGVEVEAGGQAAREVLFRRGSLLVGARNAGKELPSEAVTLTVYAAGDDQEEVVEWGGVVVKEAAAVLDPVLLLLLLCVYVCVCLRACVCGR